MAQTVPLRLRILRALTNALKEITVAGGYNHDLNDFLDGGETKKRVFRGRVTFGENDPIPMLSILEVPLPLDQVTSAPDNSASTGSWELVLQGFVEDDPENPTDPAHFLMADVKKRLAIEKKKNKDFEIFDFAGLEKHITDIRFGAGVVRPPDEVSALAYFWLTITLDVVEDLADPYED